MKILDTGGIDLTKIIQNNDMVMWGQGGAEPVPLTQTLMAQRREIGRLRVFIGSTWSNTFLPEHSDCVSFFSYCGAASNRKLAQAGVLDIWPGHYSDLSKHILDGPLRVDVLMLQVAPVDANGRYSLSLASEYLIPALKTARTVIVEVNEQAPCTHGSTWLTEANIHYAVHTSRQPLELKKATPGVVDEAIARRVADLIEDGATLQCGIGALPEAVLGKLDNRRDLGMHSGAFGDQAALLASNGVITNARKSIDRGFSVAGVLMGSAIVRNFAHQNPAVQLRSVDYTHAADILARIDRFTAINSAIEVDLTGQVNAEVAAGVYVGAVGGGADFLRGAHRSKGGLPIVALPSRVLSNGKPHSRIVSALNGPVSTARSDAGIFVTEHGTADLRGKTLAQRIKCMIDIAHPDDRGLLEREAHGVFR